MLNGPFSSHTFLLPKPPVALGFTTPARSSTPSSTYSRAAVLGDYYRTTSHRGRPSTTTSGLGASTAPERGCTGRSARENTGDRLGRDSQPSAGIADSQNNKTTGVGGEQR